MSDEAEWRDGEERSGAEIASVIGNLLHEAGRPRPPAPVRFLVTRSCSCNSRLHD